MILELEEMEKNARLARKDAREQGKQVRTNHMIRIKEFSGKKEKKGQIIFGKNVRYRTPRFLRHSGAMIQSSPENCS